MRTGWERHKKNLLSIIYAIIGLFLVSSMLIWPEETYQGARYGLELWATILVPSLFIFFIIAEILLNLGIVNMVGELVEPLMRPVFNLPGAASFVVAMGFTSGFPMGAVLTKRLCEKEFCTIAEGERLVAFTNNSSPLFIFAAVAVGMFNSPGCGLIMACAHYSSNLMLGVFLGLLSPRRVQVKAANENIFLKSLRALLRAQRNRKPLGTLMGDAIRNSTQNLFLIGGFVVFFAVTIRLLVASTILQGITSLLGALLSLLGFNPAFSTSLATGFWETTLGLRELSFLAVPLQDKAVAASVLLGWSGLSIQGQVISVLAGSGISPKLYFMGRIIQGILAGIIAKFLSSTTLIWGAYLSLPALTWPMDVPGTVSSISASLSQYLYLSCKSFILLLGIIITATIVLSFSTYIINLAKHR